jgi:4-amino-4-deoxy-L-arabinose transferase-like glycosyltransferase
MAIQKRWLWKWEHVLLASIIFVAAFLRLYNLPQTLMFQGDQGRDALIAKAILKEGDIALIGPVTSVGNMYLGPFYYYFMVPFLALSFPDPVGPAYGVALVNIVTVFLAYLIFKKLFSTQVGLLGSIFLAIMPASVMYSRFSWNPNIAPFFSLLAFWYLTSWVKTKRWRDSLLAWLMLGILFQLHYVALVFLPVAGLFMVIQIVREKMGMRGVKQLIAGLAVLLLVQAPLVAFDFRHDHLISQAFLSFFNSSERHMTPGYMNLPLGDIFVQRVSLAAYQLMGFSIPSAWLVLASALFVISSLLIWFKRDSSNWTALLLLFLLLFTSVFGLSFYKHSVFTHYVTYLYPFIALWWAIFITSFLKKRRLAFSLAAMIVPILLIINMTHTLVSTQNFTGSGLHRFEKTAELTLPHIVGSYNIVLLSDDRDYKGMNYRYFFDIDTKRPKAIYDYDGLETLVIIDESSTENILTIPLYEIQSPNLRNLTKQLTIPQGPDVYLFGKGDFSPQIKVE